MTALPPDNETQRLEKLKSYHDLTSAPAPAFDTIARLVSKILRVPSVAVSFVDESNQIIKSSVGMPEREILRSLSFSAYTITGTGPFVVKDTLEDDRFSQHPHVTSQPLIRFYAGIPILSPEGWAVGSLDVYDQKPRVLEVEELDLLIQMASLIGLKLESDNQSRLFHRAVTDFSSDQSQMGFSHRAFETLQKLSPDLIYVYEFESQNVKLCNRQEQLPFVNQLKGASPEELSALLSRFEKFKSQDQVDFDYRVLSDRGKYRHFQVRECVLRRNSNSLPLEIMGLALDSSLLVEKQERLDEMTAKFKKNSLIFTSVLNSILEAIIVTDEAGTYLYFNSTAERLLGIGMSTANSTLWSNTYGYFLSDKKTPLAPEDRPLAKALRGVSTDRMEVFVRSSALPQGAMLEMTAKPLLDEEKKIRGAVLAFHNVSQLKNAEEKLSNIELVDRLTQLPNAQSLNQLLEQRTQGDQHQSFALALIDIDQFQRLNKLHGQQSCDRILQSLARLLKYRMRKKDYLGRLQADDFYMVLTEVDEASAIRVAEGLKKAVAEAKESVPITVSIGIRLYSESFKSKPELFLQATQEALKKAKAIGKNSLHLGR